MIKEPPITTWKGIFKLGENEGKNIYLYAPSWDCDWYWGFGCLGNYDSTRARHFARSFHLDGLGNQNLYDNLKNYFGESLNIIEKDLWIFCELVQSSYRLRSIAELYRLGGASYTTNPCKDILEDFEQYKKINTVLLPALFNKIGELLKSQPKKVHFNLKEVL